MKKVTVLTKVAFLAVWASSRVDEKLIEKRRNGGKEEESLDRKAHETGLNLTFLHILNIPELSALFSLSDTYRTLFLHVSDCF